MINLSDLGQVYIVCGKTDMRRGIDTLASMMKKSLILILFLVRYSYFVAEARIDSKLYTGTAKVIGFFIKDSKMAR